jgi:hypothetical protein
LAGNTGAASAYQFFSYEYVDPCEHMGWWLVETQSFADLANILEYESLPP